MGEEKKKKKTHQNPDLEERRRKGGSNNPYNPLRQKRLRFTSGRKKLSTQGIKKEENKAATILPLLKEREGEGGGS